MSTVRFAVRVTNYRYSVTLDLSGELDVVSAVRLRTTVDDVISGAPHSVTVDLSDTTFCDVAGLRALDDTRQLATGTDARFELMGVSPYLLRVMVLSGFDELCACVSVFGAELTP
jgi:anti-anti-sigma factor